LTPIVCGGREIEALFLGEFLKSIKSSFVERFGIFLKLVDGGEGKVWLDRRRLTGDALLEELFGGGEIALVSSFDARSAGIGGLGRGGVRREYE
jgi:hypothetical protein